MVYNDLHNTVRDFCESLGFEKTYWIAYSGGLDSQVLLSLMSELRKTHPIHLRAIHINHQLSLNANSWALFCSKNAEKHGVFLDIKSITIACESGDSLEEVARNLRYQTFKNTMSEGDILLTAHHQDDQAETFFLQLMRGSGVKGLAGMPAKKAFSNGIHGRPLLDFPREILQQYAEKTGLEWIEDESNFDKKFTRNFIRHDVLSVLKSRWPSVASTISRSVFHCSEAKNLLEDYAEILFPSVIGSQKNLLSISKLLEKKPAEQRLILRYWLEKNGENSADSKNIEYIQMHIAQSASDAQGFMSLKKTEIRRFRDDLFCLKTSMSERFFSEKTWDFSDDLMLSATEKLSISRDKNRGLSPSIDAVSIRFRQGGEVAHVRGKQRHSLKNLLQEWGVPAWERDRIPLVYFEEKLISAVGYFIDPDYAAGENEIGLHLSFQINPL